MTDKYERLRAALDAVPCVKWTASRSTVHIPETDDWASKDLCITGLHKPVSRALARYIADAGPATVSALLADHDQWRQQAQYETDVAQDAIERVKELEAERDRLRGPLTKALAFIEANHCGGPDAFALRDECNAALAQEQGGSDADA